MRVLNRETTHLFFGAIATLLLAMFVSNSSYASIKPIVCKTNFGEKSFTIDRNTVAFHQEQKSGRSISSVLDTVTQKSHTGFRKTTYKDGFKHLIHIADENHFDQNEDFMAITSPKGHKMTYPINCSRVE